MSDFTTSPLPVLWQPEFRAADPETSDLRAAQDFLLRRWQVIVITFVAALALAVAALWLVPSRYTARADVLLDPRREKAIGPDETLHLISLDAADVESALVLLKANSLLLHVVETAGLAGDPEFAGPNPLGQADARAHALAALQRALSVERIGKAYALTIAATARSPDKAARLADAVAEAFVAEQRAAHLDASRRAATFFAERLGPLGEHLKASEEKLEAFRRAHNLIAKSTEERGSDPVSTVNEQQLSELNSRLTQARAQTAAAWARYDQARAFTAEHGSVDTLPEILASPVITQLRQGEAEANRKEADLSARYNDSYPPLAAARAERRDVERSIAREMARIVANLKSGFEIARAEEDRLRSGVALLTNAAGLDSGLGPRLRELERVRLVDQTIFETYLTKAKAAEQQSSFEEDDVRVISRADPHFVQVFPQAVLTLGLMGAFGLGLGVAIGLARDQLQKGFLSSKHAEAALGLPVLAAVPFLRSRDLVYDGKPVAPHRYLESYPHSPFAEAVHAIRAGVRVRDATPAKVVLVTSSSAGEGKSSLAFSFASAAAQAGQRVLLLDADLRAPTLSKWFGLEHRLGLVDMLAGVVKTAETTVPLEARLSLMPSGRKAAVPPDLFASDRMALYVEHLRRHYDLVVIDAAPVGSVVDAKILGDLCDRILFVVGWRSTARDLVARNLRALGHPAKLAGVVLNKMEERRPLPQSVPRFADLMRVQGI